MLNVNAVNAVNAVNVHDACHAWCNHLSGVQNWRPTWPSFGDVQNLHGNLGHRNVSSTPCGFHSLWPASPRIAPIELCSTSLDRYWLLSCFWWLRIQTIQTMNHHWNLQDLQLQPSKNPISPQWTNTCQPLNQFNKQAPAPAPAVRTFRCHSHRRFERPSHFAKFGGARGCHCPHLHAMTLENRPKLNSAWVNHGDFGIIKLIKHHFFSAFHDVPCLINGCQFDWYHWSLRIKPSRPRPGLNVPRRCFWKSVNQRA